MDQIFPGANVVAGVLVLVIGFGFHFGGQLISLLDWDLATKWGLQEEGTGPASRAYEQGIATADVLIGWTYGIAAVGLIVDASWAYPWAWIPGAILTYHALSFWFWTRNQRRNGDRHPTTENPLRIIWTLGNLATGILTVLVANSQMVVP